MDGYSKMSRYIANRRMRDFRAYMRDRFGTRNYKVFRSGEVRAFGNMPNKNSEAWFLFGHYPQCAIECVG